MTLAEIKEAVGAGRVVHWKSPGYRVIGDTFGRYHIVFTSNDSTIGLTWEDGVTLNGKESDFYVAKG